MLQLTSFVLRPEFADEFGEFLSVLSSITKKIELLEIQIFSSA